MLATNMDVDKTSVLAGAVRSHQRNYSPSADYYIVGFLFPTQESQMQIVRSHDQLIKTAAFASMAVATLLLLVKLGIWWLSGSTSVLSSMLDSLMDIVASVINFFAIRYALMPADDDHPFGHSKAEGIAALIQAAFIAGSVTILLLHVSERLLNPQPLQALPESLAVMLFSTLLTLVLVGYQRWVVKQTGSLAVKADSEHYASDILINLAVVVALLGAYLGVDWLDPCIALLIALILLRSVYSIAKLALGVLMDEALADDQEREIKEIILSQPGVKGVHDLKTRQAGSVQFIQFHLELDGQQPLLQAHQAGEKVNLAIQQCFPRAEILIHQDPV